MTFEQHSIRRRKRSGCDLLALCVLALMLFVCARPSVALADDKTENAAFDLNQGLIGHWAFDDGGGLVAFDASGNENHGAVIGGAEWVDGIAGGALKFDGVDDFVSIPNESHFDITGSVTVSAWIRVESFTRPWQGIVTKGDRAWRLHRARNSNTIGFACSDLSRNQTGDLFGRKAVDNSQWHHVAGVLEGKRLLIYVDGVLDAATASSPSISTNDYAVLIGANAQVGGRLFRGLIDDVRIYNRALTVDEIRKLVKSAGVVPPPMSKPIAVRLPSVSGSYVKIFDGKTLDGWNALDSSYWSVRDGAITGESTPEHPCTRNQFLVWKGGDVADFELKLKFRVRGNGCNSGVQFRSKMRDDGLAIGYQADIFQSGGYLGGVCDELHTRNGPELLSANGSRTVIDKSGNRKRTPIESMATLKPWDQWNDYHIIAKGHQIVLRINEVTASELIDQEDMHCDLSGILGLQLRAGEPMTVQFKDVFLKKPSSN